MCGVETKNKGPRMKRQPHAAFHFGNALPPHPWALSIVKHYVNVIIEPKPRQMRRPRRGGLLCLFLKGGDPLDLYSRYKFPLIKE
jgi:hypothetical protein